MKSEEIQKIIQAINDTLNVETQVKRKKKNAAYQNKQLFIAFITELDAAFIRQNVLTSNFGINNDNYDELFYSIIDKLIFMKFGKGISEVIYFYLYERRNPDGSLNEVSDEKGKPVILDGPEDLWNLVLKINPNIEKPV